jgi:hypothetical protein
LTQSSSNRPEQNHPRVTTPSLKGIGAEPECRCTLRARILWTRELTSTPASLTEKVRLGQLGTGYLHIVTSHHRSGWTRRLTKIRRRSALVNPSRSRLWRTLRTCYNLQMSFLATPYPPTRLEGGALTANHKEWRAGVAPQEEPFFPPLDRRVGYGEAEVLVDSLPSADINVNAATHRCFYV